MIVRKILVAHPDRAVREQLESRLAGMEVISVASIVEAVDELDHTFDGVILPCCFGTSEHDGLALATRCRERKVGTFSGFVLGLACNERCTREFTARRIISGDVEYAGRGMKHEMMQLDSA